jgi:hypothetical protein
MAVVIQEKTAKVTIVSGDAVPSIDLQKDRVVCHLTKGFAGADSVARAWRATGTVNLSVGPGDSLTNWQFGFIQFQKILNAGYFYAGKLSTHGSISLNIAAPPAMPRTLTLDSHDGQIPWTVAQPRFTRQGSAITTSTGDHPLNKAGTTLENKTTGKVNFLFHLLDHRKFWTIFSAQDADGRFFHLMNFEWQLRYDFMLMWNASGTPMVFKRSTLLSMGTPVAGPPTDGDVKAKLVNPQPPNANDEMLFAMARALKGGKPNRTDHPQRFANVPPIFFK